MFGLASMLAWAAYNCYIIVAVLAFSNYVGEINVWINALFMVLGLIGAGLVFQYYKKRRMGLRQQDSHPQSHDADIEIQPYQAISSSQFSAFNVVDSRPSVVSVHPPPNVSSYPPI